MKKTILGAILALTSWGSMSLASLRTEISIEPLEPEFKLSADGGVVAIQVNLNGGPVIEGLKDGAHYALVVTGNAIDDVLMLAEGAYKEATRHTLKAKALTEYSIDKTKQMVVISGKIAYDYAKKYALKGGKLAQRALETTQQVVIMESRELYDNTVKMLAYGLVFGSSVIDFAYDHFGEPAISLLNGAKNDLIDLAKKGHKMAIEFSEDANRLAIRILRTASSISMKLANEALDLADTAKVLAYSSVLFVKENAVYVFKYAENKFYQIAEFTSDLVWIAYDTAQEVTEDVVGTVGHGYRIISQLIPPIGMIEKLIRYIIK